MATSSAPAAAPAPAPRLVNLATNDEEAAAAAAAAEAAAAPASDIIIKAPDDIASKLEKEREVHRKRAERFGTEFHEPSKVLHASPSTSFHVLTCSHHHHRHISTRSCLARK